MQRRTRALSTVAAAIVAIAIGLVGMRGGPTAASADPDEGYQIMVSEHADGSDARLLNGATVSGTVYLFVAGPDGKPIDDAELTLGFGDVPPGTTHAASIDRVAAAGITKGCAPGRYCPQRTVTRAQMAAFLTRALDLPAAENDAFADDDGSPHEAAIERVAAAGITQGCGAGRFCPARPVTRGQMASFLTRALGLQGGSVVRFEDVAARSPHAGAIEALADTGITAGYGDRTFRPQQPVTRAQMASFLARAFEL